LKEAFITSKSNQNCRVASKVIKLSSMLSYAGIRLVSLVFSRLVTHLFVKYVPRPGNSEATFSVFESSCHLLLPV